MTYAALIFAAACCVLGFLLVCALVGGSEQRDALQAKVEHRDARIEDLENELRHRSMGNHPAGRALRRIAEERNEAVRISGDRDDKFTQTRRFAAEQYAGGLAEAARIIRETNNSADALAEALTERDAGHEGGAS